MTATFKCFLHSYIYDLYYWSLFSAPNVYNIPTALGGTIEANIKTAPAFSISGRLKEFADDKVLTPGPGTYENANTDVIKPKPPAYSVSARYQIPCDDGNKPGPGAYSPEKVNIYFLMFLFSIVDYNNMLNIYKFKLIGKVLVELFFFVFRIICTDSMLYAYGSLK